MAKEHCEHRNVHKEVIEEDILVGDDGHSTRIVDIFVCVDCKKEFDFFPEPDTDAEYQQSKDVKMEWEHE